ncbi:ribosome-inactivating family protein [Streptomyces sp. NPDC039022]|uniref:ribosome-inactivating family protein n=1 Tax=unclassified Streptomyces TaxID=2593676 RepID=UPI00340B8D2A
MLPIPTVRLVGRQLGVLLIALFAAFGLLSSNATPAHADTINRWTILDWDITALNGNNDDAAARSYNEFINQLYRTVGHQLNTSRDPRLWVAESHQNRFVEVRIWNRSQNHINLFFETDNLYFVGFQRNGERFRFNNAPAALQGEMRRQYRDNSIRFTDIGYDSNYNHLDSRQRRGNESYNRGAVHRHLMSLRDFSRANADSYRLPFAYIIGLTSEAARMEWIQARISQTIHSGGVTDDQHHWVDTLGGFGMDLELEWAHLSNLVRRNVVDNQPGTPVTINGRVYQDVQNILNGNLAENRPAIGRFLALPGASR